MAISSLTSAAPLAAVIFLPVTLQVVALESPGRDTPGWPYAPPGTGRGEVALHAVVDGRLYVSQSRCGSTDASTTLLEHDSDGSLSD